ncbi:hypothetical protein [Actinacidiphila sp. ITFR-21]|uniref:hypothetical protein n=1 Tax=Actinacidiphila sp. ITFR-21 TaxID=3075199 RepID=UPI00288B4407|nr:hypothetical protein [Streptomyces sp. ITFR-21]WNI20115.1 hypothetical protein RLT57_31745 [Streptomyces sp. ITFR-21]
MPSSPACPAPVPEFLAPRVNCIGDAARAGTPAEALAMAQGLAAELSDSHGPAHAHTLHAVELVAFCAQLAGRPVTATDAGIQAATGWLRSLPGDDRQVRRQVRNAVASWFTVDDAAEAARTGHLLLALLTSVYGPGHPAGHLVEQRLQAVTGPDGAAAAEALRPSGPALSVRP